MNTLCFVCLYPSLPSIIYLCSIHNAACIQLGWKSATCLIEENVKSNASKTFRSKVNFVYSVHSIGIYFFIPAFMFYNKCFRTKYGKFSNGTTSISWMVKKLYQGVFQCSIIIGYSHSWTYWMDLNCARRTLSHKIENGGAKNRHTSRLYKTSW